MQITVVTICRNDLGGLQRTFESIRVQDCHDVEWWVVDGASTDGTVEWLEQNHAYAGGWISEADRGIYDAMNKGTERATGDYLVFMNSGDSFAAPDVISKLVQEINKGGESYDLIYGDALDMLENGRSYLRPAVSLSQILFSMPTRHQSMLFRRGCLEQIPYPEGYPLSGDYALTALLSKKDNLKVNRVDFPISLFMLGGIHTTRRLSALREDYAIRRNILKANPLTCSVFYCIHLAHHCFRHLFPSFNTKLVYHG